MSIKATILSEIEKIRRESDTRLPPLTDDLALLQTGLDSLGLAILVTRLEDTLGFDPFVDSSVTSPPVTLGDFIELYETAARCA